MLMRMYNTNPFLPIWGLFPLEPITVTPKYNTPWRPNTIIIKATVLFPQRPCNWTYRGICTMTNKLNKKYTTKIS